MRRIITTLFAIQIASLLPLIASAQQMGTEIEAKTASTQRDPHHYRPHNHELQPPIGHARAPRAAQESPTGAGPIGVDASYLRLVLRVTDDGSARVVDATEQTGNPILSTFQTGSLIYEVTDGPSTLALESFVDPFERHGKSGRGTGQGAPYHFAVDEAEIVVMVPNAKLANVDKMRVRIHEILPTAGRFAVTPSRVTSLLSQNKLKTILSSPIAVASIEPDVSSVKAGGTVKFTLRAPNSVGLRYVVASSFGTSTLKIDTRRLDLTPDTLLAITLGGLLPNTFSGYSGTIRSNGTAAASINMPLIVPSGTKIYTAFVTLDPKAPSGVKAISDSVAIEVR